MRHTDDESAANSSCPEFPEFLQNVGRRSFLGSVATLLLVAGLACRRAVQTPAEITLVLIDQTWLDRSFQDRRNLELEQFTKETGIRVKLLPSPEGAVETLDAWRSLLESGAKIPDVYAVDVIWPGILAENLLDLKAFVPAQEIASHFPELIANNTVNGRLVALPCLVDVGLLFYRTDLLRHYGYRTPPRTWDELETMAARIQAGERARGQKDFCGFVWEGASSEAVTCNALEWQVSEGGGPITKDQFDIASLPRGRARIATTVGGRAYAVSRHSLYPREAAMLVRFLCRRDTQLNRIRKIGGSPTIPELYNDPGMLAANPYFSTILKTYRNDRVWRPSKETGKRYPDLSRAYYRTVHEVLEGKRTAASALSDLQVELMQITGLNASAGGASRGPHGKSTILRVPPCYPDHTVS